MDQEELLALIEQEESNCISSTSGALAEQRREAMQYYYGQPYGNEIEGRSRVVTTEVKDAVEGILPSLMAIFTSSDEIVRFEPQNQEDEASAQQATDYINYIFTRLNNGFVTLYCVFKDALLQKNGYAKVYWEDYEDSGIETYEDLSGLEVQMLLQDPELELEETVAKEDGEAQGYEGELYEKVVFRRTKKYGKVCIDPIPPEEVLISRHTPNDLTKARFVEHKTQKTISEIRQMGFDIADDIADFTQGADFNLERLEREKFDDANMSGGDETTDPATRKVWLCEAYLYVDYDEDGIAEYRKVTKVGKTVLDNVEFDSLPVVGGTAIPMPHKHYGLSIHDLVKDIQLIKSTITRQLLDNMYVANQGRMTVLDGMANMDDLLTVRPNGLIRVKALNAVQRLDSPVLGAPAYNLLDYFDKVKTNRVGSRDFGDAVDADALNAKAHTAELVHSASQERINLMARIFAETVVKQIFWKILELTSKHQQKPQVVKLRNQWVQVDPREWKNKFNMTVTVGLGTGSQQTTLNGVQLLGNLFSGAMQLGFRGVTEQNVYNLLHKAAKAVFPKDADMLVTNPGMMPPAQPKPDPEMMKIQLAAHKAEMGDSQKRDKMAVDAQLEHMRQQLEAGKVQFQAVVDKASQERDHQQKIVELMAEQERENRSRMAEAISQLAVVKAQGANDEHQTLVQGIVDSLKAQQEHQHAQMEQVLKHQSDMAMVEKEIVRDKQTGKATGVRPKK
jgi:hypothetical protein